MYSTILYFAMYMYDLQCAILQCTVMVPLIVLNITEVLSRERCPHFWHQKVDTDDENLS